MCMLSSERNPGRVHGKTKRMLEHSNDQNHNSYSADFKRTKIEPGNLLQTCVKFPRNSKMDRNLVIQAANSRFKKLNDSASEHKMPPMPCGKAKYLEQQLITKNLKAVGNEAKSTKMTAGDACLVSAESETSSCLMPHPSSRSISKNKRGVSVCSEFPHKLERLDLPPAKSEVLTNKVSWLASSLDKISDKQEFSLNEIKMEKNDPTGVATQDRIKLKQVNRDETCKVAERKTSPEYRWKSIVEDELHFSSPKGQNGQRAENFSEKMSMSRKVSCSSKSTIEACDVAKHQGKSAPEPPEAQQGIKKSASITSAASRIPNLNVALDVARSPQPTTTICSHECQQIRSRDKVFNVLKQFKELFTQLLEESRSIPIGERKGRYRADLKAASILRVKGKWINCYLCIGNVPGVQIGDRFQYRVELAIIGLHRKYMYGIHCEKIDGKSCATSIVDSGRYYHNETVTPDEFIYMGEGGNPEFSSGLKDQTLDGGNLAMKNSMDSKTPVRFIRRSQTLGASSTVGINRMNGFTFVYDGLYQVIGCTYCNGRESRYKVFKFRMKRMKDDPKLTQQTSSVLKISTIQRKQDVVDDMGCQKEKMFNSTVKNVKTSKFIYSSMPNGCGGNRRYSSGLWSKDEVFDYEAAASMAKPLISNRCAYANCANPKLKLS